MRILHNVYYIYIYVFIIFIHILYNIIYRLYRSCTNPHEITQGRRSQFFFWFAMLHSAAIILQSQLGIQGCRLPIGALSKEILGAGIAKAGASQALMIFKAKTCKHHRCYRSIEAHFRVRGHQKSILRLSLVTLEQQQEPWDLSKRNLFGGLEAIKALSSSKAVIM